DLRRMRPREGAAPMGARAAVRVDDDLAPGKAGVTHRPPGDEPSGRVDVIDNASRVDEMAGDGRQDDVCDHVFSNLLERNVRAVLRGDADRFDGDRLAGR